MNETKEPDPHLFWLLLSHTKLVQIFEDMRWSLPIYHRKSSFQRIKKLVWNEYYLCVRIMQFRHPLLFFIFLKYWLLWNRYYRLVEQYVNCKIDDYSFWTRLKKFASLWLLSRAAFKLDCFVVHPWEFLELTTFRTRCNFSNIIFQMLLGCIKVGEKCQACKSHLFQENVWNWRHCAYKLPGAEGARQPNTPTPWSSRPQNSPRQQPTCRAEIFGRPGELGER